MPIMAIASAVSAGAGAIGSVTSLFGGGSDGGALPSATRLCPDSPTSTQIDLALSRAPYSEKEELARLIRAANDGKGPQNGAELSENKEAWIMAAMGGKDCYASSRKGQELRTYFLRFVQEWGTANSGTYYATGSGSASIPADPIIINPQQGTAIVPEQTGMSGKEYAQAYIDAVLGPLRESLKAGGAAALGTAQQANAQAIETRKGIETASFLGIPILGIAALAIVVAIALFIRSR